MLIIVNKVDIQHDVVDLQMFLSRKVPRIVDVVDILHVHVKEIFDEFQLLLQLKFFGFLECF